MKRLCFLAAFLAAGVMICQFDISSAARRTQYIKDGIEYGVVRGSFRHRWWNYYERGLSFAEGEFYREALSDLKEAADQRFEDGTHAGIGHMVMLMKNCQSGRRHWRLHCIIIPKA